MKKFLTVLLLFVLLFQFRFAHTLIPTRAAELEHVVLQLRWDNQFQFGGYYAADWQGFYREEGLEVEIRSALTLDGKILSAIEQVAAGRADFGIGGADILIAYDQGADLRVAATIFQHSAARFYLKQETPYSSPADLLNLRVARRVNDLIDVELQAMLLSEGIDPQKVFPYPHQSGFDHLFSDRVQVMPGYMTSVPYFVSKLGVQLKEINPATYGVDFYGDSIFTTGKLVSQNPEVVTRFVRASLKGWDYALSHPEEIANEISNRFERIDQVEDVASFNLFQADAVKELTMHPLVELGHVNPYRWEKMYQFLKSLGLAKRELNLNTFIFDPQKIQAESEQRFRKFLAWALVLTTITLCIIFGWGYLLRKLVHQRTRELQQELTTRKQVEAALQENKDRLQSILHTAMDGFWQIDRQGQILEVNPAMCQLTGYTTKEMLQMSVSDIAVSESPQDTRRHIEKTIREGKSRFESQHRRKDSRIIDVEVSVASSPLEDGLIYGFHRDITERKRAEVELEQYRAHLEALVQERTAELVTVNEQLRREIVERKQVEEELRESETKYRTLVEESIQGFVIIQHGRYVFMNSAFADLLGYSVDELQSLPEAEVSMLVHPDDRQEILQRVRDRLAGKTLLPSYEFRLVHKDGSIRWIGGHSSPINYAGQPAIQLLAVDITERKKMEEQIQAALREKEILLREIHHRVKNNIQAIASMFRLQQRQIGDEKVVAVLKEGENRVRTMGLVHEMLYQTQDLARIDLEDYLKRLVNHLFRSYGISSGQVVPRIDVEDVFLELDTAIPCGLLVNELVSNSLKHAFPTGGRGEVTISLRSVPSASLRTGPSTADGTSAVWTGEDMFELVVGDNGIGLPQEVDLKNTNTLGLTLVLGWVNQLQGEIELDQAGGTRFQIRFKELEYK